MESRHKKYVQDLLKKADIEIGGTRPWDMVVHDERLYKRVISKGSLGLGEAYMDGWWDVKELDQFFHKAISAGLGKEIEYNFSSLFVYLTSFLSNGQKKNPFKVGEEHYDTGNDLFEKMLDKRMVYTCGYWKDADSLDKAQEDKLDMVCRKIGLSSGQSVLDIGCGWGSYLKFAAEKYGAKGFGVTVSKEQAQFIESNKGNLPINVFLQDYKDVEGKFDHVISLGMFEHVGRKNYRTYMEKAREVLSDEGVFLLHTIGKDKSSVSIDPWIEKYIFPHGFIPSYKEIAEAADGLFVMEDWHNFGPDYDKTLMAWFHNFDKHWPELKDKYGDRFYRMWKYYLLSCAGAFRSRKIELWQIVFSKKGIPGGFKGR
ncbi:MAG: cyclopropane fatty acyl phospholipid synthase [Candidatus Pacebacteria bacterium]|nr:cyclopropane fatty acyl phospholipid synthase [Candidatus Paceibacterota bacterium]